jgi:hypothetical protein
VYGKIISGRKSFIINTGLLIRHTHGFPIGDTPQTDKWFWKFLE